MSDLSDLYRARVRFDASKHPHEGRGYIRLAQAEADRTALIDKAVAKIITALEAGITRIEEMQKEIEVCRKKYQYPWQMSRSTIFADADLERMRDALSNLRKELE